MASETQILFPPHHARRPMNAFLIFCKRHRNVVKEHYPNFENRCITKILGEWWASLDNIEKSAYTELAKQYKDAFFTANPDFKWYKLPAPSLRMLSNRPETVTNMSSYYNSTSNNMINMPEENYEDSKCQVNEGNKYNDIHNPQSDSENEMKIEEEEDLKNMFSPVKLADETQLGGLRNLIDIGAGFYNNNGNNNTHRKKFTKTFKKNSKLNNNVSDDDEDLYACERNYKANELEHALHEANSYIVNVFDEHCPVVNSHSYVYEGPKISGKKYNAVENGKGSHNNVMEMDIKQETDLDPPTNFHNCLPLQYKSNDFHERSCELYLRQKSSRSCKGKRYEEFKIKGLINRKPKHSMTNKNAIYLGYNHEESMKTETNTANNESNTFDNIMGHPANVDEIISSDYNENIKRPAYPKPEFRPTANKFFHASDFDLEGKIKALPLLNLDEYLLKKKENKNIRKQIKKHGVKQKINEIPCKNKSHIVNKLKVMRNNDLNNTSQTFERETLIGSRKRKAVKQRITHLELKKSNTGGVMKHKNLVSYPMNYLCDLSTLAEVAAKSSKITTNVDRL